MEITIQNKVKQSELFRTVAHVKCAVENKATPSRVELREAIAKQMKAQPELVVVTSIKTNYGSAGAIVTAHVYDNIEALKRNEATHRVKRHEPKQQAEA